MEAIPRITRAQSMDALSSQANLGGYMSVLIAARESGKLFPMMTTAAGTIPPAKVLVLGAAAKRQDVIITTAQIPGRPAPRLITADAVRNMAPGSVIIDLAAESGGNVEGSKPGETVEQDGVKIIGPANLPSQMAGNASALYAKNLQNLVELLIDDEGNLKVDTEDEIIAGSLLTKDGEIVNERAKEAASA